ncbi:MAG: ABC transporter permease [Rhodospirillales bacterium]|mgnify:CR=1 FL=1|jgi:spermidine/putrescine transport system permease protein|nr:ABC transporter permease [Rhodospirillales bacterium]MBT4040425.1 ABC transporter permease [Rhodospirillales bacterium]MBT4628133.1 ABC transporter permease [Rhodospirillales bacterium]MBT5352593.1 ABC transporter permease [Rhodospirillales bacterium]MBT5522084.1 ABC transporter permease [Rhodospirillales bacterium]
MKESTRRKATSFAIVSTPFIWTMVFLFVPYMVMFTYSFYLKKFPTFIPAFEFVNYLTIVTDPQYYQVLLRTSKIAVTVACSSLLIAYPLSYFLVFKVQNKQIRSMLYMAVIVPLWVSYLLRAYTWKTILGNEGILNSFLVWSGFLDQPTDIFLYNQFSMVVTLTYIFVPFMVMPIFMALEKIPRSMIEASKDLGVGPFRTFLRVTLPLSMPGVIAGATFTICLTFGDFVASFLVGGPNGAMIATIIQSQFGATLNWPLGAALSIVMLVFVLTIISLSDRLERAGRIDLD